MEHAKTLPAQPSDEAETWPVDGAHRQVALARSGASTLEQWRCLFTRSLHDVTRNIGANIGKTMQNVSTSLITIALYQNMGKGNVVTVQERDRLGVLFFVTINGLFGPLFGTVQAFSPEVSRAVFMTLGAMGV